MNQASLAKDILCIAVDWGTTNLRAFLIDQTGQVLDQRQSNRGMLTLEATEFEEALRRFLSGWLATGVPIYMSGMVGSRGGWQEVPYQHCPMPLAALTEHLYWLPTSLPCPVAIVPGLQGVGVSGHQEVMRGEETQLLGALDWLQSHGRGDEPPLCCLPGTHCKWVHIEQGEVRHFSTTLSGELFARLNDESSLVKGLPISHTLQTAAFTKGLVASQQAGGLLHQLFSVRSQFVCGALAAAEVRDYLSGIVIGHDVKDMLAALAPTQTSVLLIGNQKLTQRYALALSSHGLKSEFLDASEASIRGLTRLAISQAHRLAVNGGSH